MHNNDKHYLKHIVTMNSARADLLSVPRGAHGMATCHFFSCSPHVLATKIKLFLSLFHDILI